jgi:hypothetical protein
VLHCSEDILHCTFHWPSRFPLYPLYPQTGGNCGGTETSLGSTHLRSQRPPADTGNQPKASSREFLGPCWPDRGRGFARKPIARVSHGTAGYDFGRAAADAAMKAGSSSMAYSEPLGEGARSRRGHPLGDWRNRRPVSFDVRCGGLLSGKLASGRRTEQGGTGSNLSAFLVFGIADRDVRRRGRFNQNRPAPNA